MLGEEEEWRKLVVAPFEWFWVDQCYLFWFLQGSFVQNVVVLYRILGHFLNPRAFDSAFKTSCFIPLGYQMKCGSEIPSILVIPVDLGLYIEKATCSRVPCSSL